MAIIPDPRDGARKYFAPLSEALGSKFEPSEIVKAFQDREGFRLLTRLVTVL
jgi:hypothetical protein